MFRNRLNAWTMVCAMAVTALFAGAASAADGWGTNFEKAAAQAKKEGKVILADFTGSDWCGWCIKLNQEVFNTDEFKSWAKDKVVLLELDFPQNKPQDDATKKQNQELAKKYGIRGYPTILFLTPDGEKVGQSGYMPGGPAAWTADAEKKIKDHVTAKPGAAAAEGEGDKPAKNVEAPTSYADGVAKAKENDMLLFVAAYTGKQEAAANAAKELVEDEAFKQFTNGRVLVLALDTDDESKKDDIEVFDAFRKAQRVRATPVQFLLINAKEDKALTRTYQPVKAAALIKQLERSVPKPAAGKSGEKADKDDADKGDYNGEWVEDFAKAQALSKKLKRPMLLNFTGSDWCGYCIKMDQDVFSKSEFKEFAKGNLILVKLDFPRNKPQSEALKKQNLTLQQKYNISGYPTFILLDQQGRKAQEIVGYIEGGPQGFINKLKGGA